MALWILCIAPATAATIGGVVTYKYNDPIGTKGDEGSTVYLVRLPVKKPIADAEHAKIFSLEAIPGTQRQTVDGFGGVEFDDVAPGQYLVVIISEQTTRDASQPLDSLLTAAIRPLFATEALWNTAIGPVWDVQAGAPAPADETILGLQAAIAFPLTVKGERAHFSWDFGATYL